MTRITLPVLVLGLSACGGAPPPGNQDTTAPPGSALQEPAAVAADSATETPPAATDDSDNVFRAGTGVGKDDKAPAHESKIQATEKEAALKLVLVDKDKGPIPGIVVNLTAPDGTKYYANETDATGYTEVLVPVGQKYDLTYLSLGIGRRDIAAKVDVPNEPNLNLKLTLRYKRWIPPVQPAGAAKTRPDSQRFTLGGVEFDTGKATLKKDSLGALDGVIEYMQHKPSARIEVSGHTDNVGNAKANMTLSQKRAEAVRQYLIGKGIDGARIEAQGYGDTLPIADNNTDEGRQKNRRIEATEL